MRSKPSLIIGLALVVILLIPTASLAVGGKTYTWIGMSGNWSNPGSWSPGDGPPVLYDKAVIGNGVEVTSNAGAGVSQLSIGTGSALLITEGGLNFNDNDGAVETFILNEGFIRVQNRDGGAGANIDTWGANLSLQGGGTIYLGGDVTKDSLTDNGWGGTVTHTATHTIRGGGLIHATFINQGAVIADNGILNFSQSNITNASTLSANGSGNVLGFLSCIVSGGQINPQDGKIYMLGSTFSDLTFGPGLVEVDAPTPGTQSCIWNAGVNLSSGTTVNILKNLRIGPINGSTTLVNDGTMVMYGTGCRLYGSNHLTLQGAGSLVMGGDGDNYLELYDIKNNAPHTIQGGGTIGTHIINDSAFIANNGMFTIYYGRITGSGTVSVADGATLNLVGNSEASLQTGDLTMSHLASLTVGSNVPIDLKRNFSFAQTDPARWSWATTSLLKMSGQGPIQTLEVGGGDYGASISGLVNNFALEHLQIGGTGTQAALVDLIDNGHRAPGGREALYTETLTVLPGATLDLKGLKLYVKLGGIMHRVMSGEGSLFGDGNIIDTSGGKMLPGLMLLLD